MECPALAVGVRSPLLVQCFSGPKQDLDPFSRFGRAQARWQTEWQTDRLTDRQSTAPIMQVIVISRLLKCISNSFWCRLCYTELNWKSKVQTPVVRCAVDLLWTCCTTSCHWTSWSIGSIDFLMKMFQTSDSNIVKFCRWCSLLDYPVNC